MTATDRRTALVAALLLLAVGFGFGFLAGDDFNFDQHSYMGGISYIVTRDSSDSGQVVDPLTACKIYVNTQMNLVDGYISGESFLQGCTDAYRDSHRQKGSFAMPQEPNYIVIRPAPCVDVEDYPSTLFGCRLNLGSIPMNIKPDGATPQGELAVPTGEFEVGDTDGAVAEIYLIHSAVHTCG